MTIELLKEGQIFAERYAVVRCIASGGMGAVYEVTHTETGRRCAMKIMLPNIVLDDALRERFKREARVSANIKSDFIVDVLDAGIDAQSDLPFIVMEYLVGEDLGHLVARQGRIAPADVITYLHQAALALAKTHAAGIVHRDLKPENMFLTTTDEGLPRIKILDFGISKVVVEADTQSNRTQSLGTPMYMAPEQMRGRVVPATDTYALAMVGYTLLVGKAYYQGEGEEQTVYELMARVLMGPDVPAVENAARQGATLPAAIDEWFAKATAPNPEHRHRTALEMVSTLALALGLPVPLTGSGPVTVPPPASTSQRLSDMQTPGLAVANTVQAPPTGPAATRPTPRSNATTRLALAGAVLAVVAAVAVALILRDRPSNEVGIVASVGVDSSAAVAASTSVLVVMPPDAPDAGPAAVVSASGAPPVPIPPPVAVTGGKRPAGVSTTKPAETTASPPTTATPPPATGESEFSRH